jgi:hypothetical protein
MPDKRPLDTETRCPYCDHLLDGAWSFEGATPSPGDLSVCINCAKALVFSDDLRLQPLTVEEFATLNSEEQHNLRQHQRLIVAYNLHRRNQH